MTREEREIIEAIKIMGYDRTDYPREKVSAVISMAIEALSAEAVQGCDGCRYNTRIPQKLCLRCKRYWRDSYERKGGEAK